jgi:hypothetical protein
VVTGNHDPRVRKAAFEPHLVNPVRPIWSRPRIDVTLRLLETLAFNLSAIDVQPIRHPNEVMMPAAAGAPLSRSAKSRSCSTTTSRLQRAPFAPLYSGPRY